MSHILVTGINSPLGQAVGRKLQAEGHSVVGTVRSSKINTKGLPADELIPLDLENEGSFANITGSYNAFVHVAGASLGLPYEVMRSTGLGTLYLINTATKLNVKRLIHISGMDVFGTVSTPSVNEVSEINYQRAYGLAKWAAESYIADVSEFIEGISIRSPAIAGLNHHRHFLAQTVQKMLKGDQSVTVSNPNFFFNNIIHEDVLANFISKLLSQPKFPNFQALVVGSNEPMSLEQILNYLAKITLYRGEIKWIESSVKPFSIDFSNSIKCGYEPITVLETLSMWAKNLGLSYS